MTNYRDTPCIETNTEWLFYDTEPASTCLSKRIRYSNEQVTFAAELTSGVIDASTRNIGYTPNGEIFRVNDNNYLTNGHSEFSCSQPYGLDWVCTSFENRHIFVDLDSETYVSKVYLYAGLTESDFELESYTQLSVRCLKAYSQTFTECRPESKPYSIQEIKDNDNRKLRFVCNDDCNGLQVFQGHPESNKAHTKTVELEIYGKYHGSQQWTQISSTKYIHLSERKYSFANAIPYCQNLVEGGNLVHPESETENEEIYSTVRAMLSEGENVPI